EIPGHAFALAASECVVKVVERDGDVAAMPLLPADRADVRQIAAADQVEQEIVALDQAARTARLDLTLQRPAVAFVLHHPDAGQRDAVLAVGARRAPALLVDLRQRRAAVAARLQLREVLTDAAAAAALARAGRLVLVAAAAVLALARQPALAA